MTNAKEIEEILQKNIHLETFLFPKLIIHIEKLIYLKVFFFAICHN